MAGVSIYPIGFFERRAKGRWPMALHPFHMTIYQYEDKGLAHYSYVIMSEFQVMVVDPTRNPKQYYEYTMMHDAQLAGVLLTHAHADFVGGHHDVSQVKRVPLYLSRHLEVKYKHHDLDDGDEITLGKITLQTLYTPGHSYDSLSILATDEEGKPHALFSGDTLLIGDVGRPDLREAEEGPASRREELARAMYQTLQDKILPLPDHVLVYPAHGAGSLCGKGMRNESSSTIGEEKRSNPALRPMSEQEFVQFLMADLPYTPKYFRHALTLNKQGPTEYEKAIKNIPRSSPDHEVEHGELVIDTRPQADFKKGHIPGAINIMNGLKFETWLGSVVAPEEEFYLVCADEETLKKVTDRTTRIGYEEFIEGTLVYPEGGASIPSPKFDLDHFREQPEEYTILDIRNRSEVQENPLFPDSINIPLPELRHKVGQIPLDKPIMVHCTGGFRSAIGSSFISRKIDLPPVYDLGNAVKDFFD
jgi:hydroxyacylglutathione hydrolase